MVAPLFDQFAAMQQQMFEQYHQSMMELLRAFGVLQRDREAAVDRELQAIRRLTREVRALHRELDLRRAADRGDRTVRSRAAEADEPIPLPPPAAGTGQDYREAAARIMERMVELQQERQTRWQRPPRQADPSPSAVGP